MRKRWIGALLALCMVLAMLPAGVVTARAEDNTFTFTNAADAYVFTKSGNDILITSEEDWNALSAAVKAGNTCKGLSFRLTDDISVSCMVGEQISNSTVRRFAGSFDGDGCTLTVNLDASVKAGQFKYNQNYAAPFGYANGVTVKNLVVAGTIKTNKKYAAGVVASLTNGGRLENVCVTATIDSRVNGDGTHGGLVAINENGPAGAFDRSPLLILKDCSFEGRFLGKNTYNCGGLVGFNKAKVRLQDCIFAPLELTINDGFLFDLSETFVRMEASNPMRNLIVYGDNYYTIPLGYVNYWAIWACSVLVDADEGCDVTVKCNGVVIKHRALVLPGAKLTVEAKAKPGYVLIETPRPRYTVWGNLVIRARSKAVEQGYVVTLNHENGAEPTWSGVQSLTNAHYGDYLTITAGAADEGYEFIGWYQSNGKLLTKSETYNVYVYSDVTYEARYQLAANKVVAFISNDLVLKTMEKVDAITADDFPANPTPNSGYRFVGWSMTAEEVNAALASEAMAAGGTVTVSAKFEKIVAPGSFAVSICNGEQEDRINVQLNAGQWYDVSAMEVPGKYFAYWKCEQSGGFEVRSYRENTSFWLTQDSTLTAVYDDAAVEQLGTAGLTSVTYDKDSSKLISVAYLTVPDGAIIRAAGLVAASNNEGSKYTAGDALITDNADYVKALANAVGQSEPVIYTWTKTKVNKPGEVWYVRPYVIYADESGAEHTIYGEMYTAVIDDLMRGI